MHHIKCISSGFNVSHLDGEPEGREIHSENLEHQETTRLEQSTDCTTRLVLHL